MNYIVMDLEWNQSKKEEENQDMKYEIIQIGAVKLDSNLEIIDEFSSYIRPQVYLEMDPFLKKILSCDMEDLKKEKCFIEVINEFFNWCGSDYYICTWGELDLYYLQNNMEFYHIKRQKGTVKYYDLQKIYSTDSLYFSLEQKKTSLHTAVNQLQIPEDESFHSAIHDARYTAKVLQKMGKGIFYSAPSIDCYDVPKSKSEEVMVRDYYGCEYIFREFPKKEELLRDREVRRQHCYQCDRQVKRKLKWFLGSYNLYYSVTKCKEHGLILGKIKVKETKDGTYFCRKGFYPIKEEVLEELLLRQENIREKRREKERK